MLEGLVWMCKVRGLDNIKLVLICFMVMIKLDGVFDRLDFLGYLGNGLYVED